MRIADALARILPKQQPITPAEQTAGTPGPAAADAYHAPAAAPVQLNPAPIPGVAQTPTFTGFDNTKMQDPLKLQDDGQPKSAKYTFAKLAQASGVMPQNKQEAEAWFNQYIRPGMEAAGFHVTGVKGDTAMICTREHPEGEPIDFMRGAGSGDPSYMALSWQTQDTGGGGSAFGFGDPTTSLLGDPLLNMQKTIGDNARADADRLQRDLDERKRSQTINPS